MTEVKTYFLCYDLMLGWGSLTIRTHRKGKQKIDNYPHDKDFSLAVSEKLCDIYGQGTHWIEDETGELITRGD